MKQPKSLKSNVGNSNAIEKEKLIVKILKYQNNKRFGPTIKKDLGMKHTRTSLGKHTLEKLEVILHRIRTHLNTQNLDAVFDHMAKQTARGYEDIVSNVGYDIEGFSDMLLQNPAFWDTFERWKVEQQAPEIPISFQLMYIIASTTYIAHIQNKHIKKVSKPASPPSPPPPPPPVKDLIIKDEDKNRKVGDIL